MAQQPVEMILTKQWAGYLTVPVFVMDAEGNLLYYNEPAEELLGGRFDDVGELPAMELASIFVTTAVDGTAIPPEELPIVVALMQRRPAHLKLQMRALNGVSRVLEVTAFPIEGRAGRFLGAVAMFWEAPA